SCPESGFELTIVLPRSELTPLWHDPQGRAIPLRYQSRGGPSTTGTRARTVRHRTLRGRHRLLVVLVASTLFGTYLAHGCNRPHRLRWHIAALLAAIAAFIYTLTEAEWAVSQSLLQNVEPGIGPALAAWGAIGLAVGEVVAFAAFLVSRLRFEDPEAALVEAGGDGPSGQ